jgi:hypothetical protein
MLEANAFVTFTSRFGIKLRSILLNALPNIANTCRLPYGSLPVSFLFYSIQHLSSAPCILDMSISEFDSDLTDISSDDDSPLWTSNTRSKSDAKGRDYQLRGSLRPPRTSQFSAKALYGSPASFFFNVSEFVDDFFPDQIVENTIDLDPEYQRGTLRDRSDHLHRCFDELNASPYSEVVWPETKQSGLIDSLLHNYYVPPIIFG